MAAWLSAPVLLLARIGFFLQNVASAATTSFARNSTALTVVGGLVSVLLTGVSWIFLSGLVAVAMTYLSEEIDPKVIGLAMGLYIGGNALGGMMGRLIVGVIVDFVSWRIAVGAMGGLALAAAAVFWKTVPPSRHFHPTPLNLPNLMNGFRHHLKDGALPWLFFEGFLLMGGFVTLFNYITYRLLGDSYHLSQAVVGSV